MKNSTAVIIQQGSLALLPCLFPLLEKYQQFVIFSHPEIIKLYGPSLSSLKIFKRPILEILIPQGEQSKSLTQAQQCWKKMFVNGVDKRTAFIALGGGVICDLGGFVASCYMRGLDLYLLPTTLLAMIDAAIGGKVAVNLQRRKNIIGQFYFPQGILIDIACLNSLPQREFISGLAEMIKYGIISDPLLFEEIENKIEEIKKRPEFILEEVIRRCVDLKKEIIESDENDLTGKRAVLNYGHTFGHAIEVVTDFRSYLHGEAVSIGMSCAAHLSEYLGLCDSSVVKRQDYLCLRAGLPINISPCLSIKRLIKAMQGDKKAICAKINLILLERIGKVNKICDVDPLLIEKILSFKNGEKQLNP